MLLGVGQMFTCFLVLPAPKSSLRSHGNPRAGAWDVLLSSVLLLLLWQRMRWAMLLSAAQRRENKQLLGHGKLVLHKHGNGLCAPVPELLFFLEFNSCLQIIGKRRFTSPNVQWSIKKAAFINLLNIDMKTRKSQIWICHRTKFWNQCHFNATGFNSQDFTGIQPTLHESFCWWKRQYFWLWFWPLLTSLPSTISLELVYMGKTMHQPSIVLISGESHTNRTKRGPKNLCSASCPSVFLAPIYFK